MNNSRGGSSPSDRVSRTHADVMAFHRSTLTEGAITRVMARLDQQVGSGPESPKSRAEVSEGTFLAALPPERSRNEAARDAFSSKGENGKRSDSVCCQAHVKTVEAHGKTTEKNDRV